MGWFRLFRSVVALVMGVFGGLAFGVDETTMKAAYLYNFAKFTQWPDEQRPILRLCVMGEDRGRSLDSLIGKPVRTMQIGVRHAVSLHEIPQCDLVFVPREQALHLERVRQIVNNYPILIVTETTDALPKGAMMALIQSDSRIVFEIDLATSRQLGLQVSAKMLQLARKVY